MVNPGSMLDLILWTAIVLSVLVIPYSRGFQSNALFPFALSIVLSASVEFAALWSSHAKGSNIIVYNAYMPLEFILLMWYASNQLGDRLKRVWPLFVLGYVLILTYDLVSMEDPTMTMATKAFTLGIVILAPLYFYLLYREADCTRGSLVSSPHFWANFSIVFCFVTLGPAMGLLRYLVMEASPLANTITIVFPVIAIVRYGLSITSFFVYAAGRSLPDGKY